jgi:hypothetical protein
MPGAGAGAGRSERVSTAVAAGAAFSVLFAAGVARGAEPGGGQSTPIAIELDAHAGCPDAEEFFAEVRARTPRVRHAAPGEPARRLRVRIAEGPTGSMGAIAIVDADGATSTRAVAGESCGEVASALSLIAALSVDPDASTSPAPASAPIPATASTAGTASPEGAMPVPPPPPAPAPLAPTVVPAPAAESASPPPRPTGPRWRWTAGGHLAAVSAGAAGLLAAPSVFLDVARDAASRPGPSVRVGVTSFHGQVPAGFGVASLTWTLAQVEGCPVAVTLVANVTARPCAAASVGSLRSAGEGLAVTHASARPWVAAGVRARAQWVLVDTLLLEVEAGASVPFVRDQFILDPGLLVYEPPAIVADATVGLGVRFP